MKLWERLEDIIAMQSVGVREVLWRAILFVLVLVGSVGVLLAGQWIGGKLCK